MSHPPLARRQSGFTLIEIAIVLVIIGLLLGGILKGQDITPPSGGTLGDGIISGTYNSATSTDESRQFWLQLRRAGLVGGAVTDDTTPPNAASGVTGVQNGAFGIPGLVICSNNLPAKIAQAIDTQFDDGKSDTGTVRAAAGTTAGSTPDTSYIDDGTKFYVVCKAP
ncbi:MAG: prepilin-type N-terminal cleavage/methylation domain-containing protein [Thiobacillus sp.]|nr:prepilin-type N-terminal cleavage/methylation domain-containing protein [Thiobacillus sp.]